MATIITPKQKQLIQNLYEDEGEAGRLSFIEIEPHPHPIDPAALLDEVSDTIRSFIVLDIEQAHVAALRAALSWFIDVVEVAPLITINAPEKSCGKTQLLTVIGRTARKLSERVTAWNVGDPRKALAGV